MYPISDVRPADHLATVKVTADGSSTGLGLVEFCAPRRFATPVHSHPTIRTRSCIWSKARSSSASDRAWTDRPRRGCSRQRRPRNPGARSTSERIGV